MFMGVTNPSRLTMRLAAIRLQGSEPLVGSGLCRGS